MKILMVCLGNICRSPLAEGVMRHLAAENNLDWHVESAGTGDWHIGQSPDHRSISIAKQYGYDISAQKAKHFTGELFDQFDHVLVMDRSNLKNVLALAKTMAHRQKVRLFLDDAEVTDPYFDPTLFDPVFREIETRCKELIGLLR